MIKIEFVKSENDSERSYATYNIMVNGVIDERSFCFTEDLPEVEIRDERTYETLIAEKFLMLSKTLSKITFRKNEDAEDEIVTEIYLSEPKVSIRNVDNGPIIPPAISIYIKYNWKKWARAWSIADYAEELEANVGRCNNLNVRFFKENSFFEENGFGIYYPVDSSEKRISDEVDYLLRIFRELSTTATKNLVEKLNRDSLITYFHFPKEVKAACNQYLIYFAQFLADIGIDANTEIKDDANRTLFRVIPENKDEALSKIREALDIYINAPGFQSMNEQTGADNNIALMQWQANIFHLKSQLALNAAVMQAKDATIEALQLSNYQYKQILDQKEEEATEELIPGVVAVEKIKGQGLVIDLPELLRKLKRRFK